MQTAVGQRVFVVQLHLRKKGNGKQGVDTEERGMQKLKKYHISSGKWGGVIFQEGAGHWGMSGALIPFQSPKRAWSFTTNNQVVSTINM